VVAYKILRPHDPLLICDGAQFLGPRGNPAKAFQACPGAGSRSNRGRGTQGAGAESGFVRDKKWRSGRDDWSAAPAGNVGRVADALPGRPSPLGATPSDGGINFAVASGVAEAAEVCLFGDSGEETRWRLRDYDDGLWHGFVPGAAPGQAYGVLRGPRGTLRWAPH